MTLSPFLAEWNGRRCPGSGKTRIMGLTPHARLDSVQCSLFPNSLIFYCSSLTLPARKEWTNGSYKWCVFYCRSLTNASRWVRCFGALRGVRRMEMKRAKTMGSIDSSKPRGRKWLHRGSNGCGGACVLFVKKCLIPKKFSVFFFAWMLKKIEMVLEYCNRLNKPLSFQGGKVRLNLQGWVLQALTMFFGRGADPLWETF